MGLTGLEPVTLRLSSACSNQLSYRPEKGGKGIAAMPLLHVRISSRHASCGGKGIDRRGDLSKAGLRLSVQTSYGGKGIRTPDIQLAKLALYQLSYAPRKLYRPGAARKGQRTKTELWVIRHQVVHVFT